MDVYADQRVRYRIERTELLKEFASNLRDLRSQASQSQESLSEAARLHRTGVGYLEQGRREPGLLTLLILADAFDISLDRLVQGLPVPKERRPPPNSKRQKARK